MNIALFGNVHYIPLFFSRETSAKDKQAPLKSP